jgi:D-alanine-D-alanine ligase-like ATP-grasp enzyme
MKYTENYPYRINLWKTLCDKKSYQYTINQQIPSYIVLHLSKDYTFYGRKDSFNSPIASMVSRNKSTTYLLLRDAHIPIPTSIIVSKGDDEISILNNIKTSSLDYPLIVKPSNTNNSVHVYRVPSISMLLEKVQRIFNDNTYNISEIVIQQHINIKIEYRVLTFNKNIAHNLPNKPAILLAYSKLQLNQRSNSEIYNKDKITEVDCSIVKNQDLLNKFQKIIEEVVKYIPSLSWSGIDIVEDENGKLWFLEINSDPGFKLLRKIHGDEKIEEVYSKMLDYMVG